LPFSLTAPNVPDESGITTFPGLIHPMRPSAGQPTAQTPRPWLSLVRVEDHRSARRPSALSVFSAPHRRDRAVATTPAIVLAAIALSRHDRLAEVALAAAILATVIGMALGFLAACVLAG
jgi:hypothetical protein